LAGPASAQQVKELTFWSHWAAEVPKRTFVEEAIRQFEAKNPGIKIKQTWYEKTALYAGLKTALRANQAPDIFYAEPDQAEYMENGFLLDLSGLNWAAVEPWAKEAWTYQGKPYGLPLEAWTVELYYNKKTMADLGVSVPENLQLSPDAFLDMIKKADEHHESGKIHLEKSKSAPDNATWIDEGVKALAVYAELTAPAAIETPSPKTAPRRAISGTTFFPFTSIASSDPGRLSILAEAPTVTPLPRTESTTRAPSPITTSSKRIDRSTTAEAAMRTPEPVAIGPTKRALSSTREPAPR
jgi:hypothetical protein